MHFQLHHCLRLICIGAICSAIDLTLQTVINVFNIVRRQKYKIKKQWLTASQLNYRLRHTHFMLTMSSIRLVILSHSLYFAVFIYIQY